MKCAILHKADKKRGISCDQRQHLMAMLFALIEAYLITSVQKMAMRRFRLKKHGDGLIIPEANQAEKMDQTLNLSMTPDSVVDRAPPYWRCCLRGNNRTR